MRFCFRRPENCCFPAFRQMGLCRPGFCAAGRTARQPHTPKGKPPAGVSAPIDLRCGVGLRRGHRLPTGAALFRSTGRQSNQRRGSRQQACRPFPMFPLSAVWPDEALKNGRRASGAACQHCKQGRSKGPSSQDTRRKTGEAAARNRRIQTYASERGNP